MAQDPAGRPEGEDLPDFVEAETTRDRLAVPLETERRRSRAVIISVVAASIVGIAVIALILSQTVFRSALDDPTVKAAPTVGTASGHSEYVPDPKDPQLEPPPPIFTQQPTTECVSSGSGRRGQLQDHKLRAADLEVTIPDSWDYSWMPGNVAFMEDGTAYGRNVEGSWYSVVNIGRVWWPDSAGTYPGSEQAAITMFQCYATSGGLLEYFGDKPQVTDYRSEATVVDGQPAWIVQATYHFEKSQLSTTNASVVTSLVVETPGGPSALVSDVAADHPDHVRELGDILSSMKVTS